MKPSLISGFTSVAGTKGQRILNTKTGEEISRRQYEKIKYGGLSKETLAALNRAQDLEKSLQRPTRGRTSAINKEAGERRIITEARKEQYAEKIKKEKEAKEANRVHRKIERLKTRKVRTPRITARSLKPGAYARKVNFSSYEAYEQIQSDIEKLGRKVFSYSIGLIGVDTRDGTEKGITMFKMLPPDELISEEELMDETENWLAEKMYLEFVCWFAHIAFSVEYADQWAIKHGLKRNPRQNKK